MTCRTMMYPEKGQYYPECVATIELESQVWTMTMSLEEKTSAFFIY